MWIKELILNNIQAFEDQRILFSEGINLIVGKNNTGKSTIIRSLLNFQQNNSGKPELLQRKYSNQGYVVATVVGLKQLSTLKEVPPSETPSLIFNAKNRSFGQMAVSSTLPDSGQDLHNYIEENKRNGEMVDHTRFTDDEASNVFLPFLAKRKTQYINSQFDERSLKSVDHDFRNLASKLSRATANTYKKDFEAACIDILNFVPSTIPSESGANMTTVAQYIGADESIPLEQMGDGVIQIIGLLVNLFQTKNKVYLIEEIENDLHPDALKKLLNLILKSSEKNQFIISTHSNIVLSYLGQNKNAKIFETRSVLIEDEVNRTSLFKSAISEIGNTADERIRILRDLGYDLSDFHLWTGYLILEESSAEKLIRDFLIPVYCPRLINRLATIGAKGASDVPTRYSHLRSVFTFIHTTEVYKEKAWVCVDNDKAGNEALKKLENSFSKSWDTNHFITFSKPNFEDYYPTDYAYEINAISRENDPIKRGTIKLDLAKQVVEQYKERPTEISNKFEISAKEIIDILKKIETNLLDT